MARRRKTKRTQKKSITEIIPKWAVVFTGIGVLVTGCVWIARAVQAVPKAEANTERIELVEDRTQKLQEILDKATETNEMLGQIILDEKKRQKIEIHKSGKYFRYGPKDKWRPIRELEGK